MIESQGRPQAWTARAASGLFWTGMFLMAAGSCEARAADTETRHFTITVDGKRAGSHHLAIRQQGDNTVAVTGEADVRVRFLIYKYRYWYRGTEVWKDGRLLELKSASNDDGMGYTVNARAEGNVLRVQVNGVERTTRPDVWSTTYWHLPAPKYRNRSVPLLDADTGREILATLQYQGRQHISVAGELADCAHYHLSGGGLRVDLWYDGQDRLVREVSVENGKYETVFELARIGP